GDAATVPAGGPAYYFDHPAWFGAAVFVGGAALRVARGGAGGGDGAGAQPRAVRGAVSPGGEVRLVARRVFGWRQGGEGAGAADGGRERPEAGVAPATAALHRHAERGVPARLPGFGP